MIHPIYRILDCEHIPPYSLQLKFDDGTQRLIDLTDVLEGAVYGPLKDVYLFAQVSVDPEIQTVVWPNGADFDPAILHDWPQHRDMFIAAAKRWRPVINTAEQGATANP